MPAGRARSVATWTSDASVVHATRAATRPSGTPMSAPTTIVAVAIVPTAAAI